MGVKPRLSMGDVTSSRVTSPRDVEMVSLGRRFVMAVSSQGWAWEAPRIRQRVVVVVSVFMETFGVLEWLESVWGDGCGLSGWVVAYRLLRSLDRLGFAGGWTGKGRW